MYPSRSRPKRTAFRRVALAGIVVVVLAASCGSAKSAAPVGTKLAMIGDSLAVLGDAQITEQLERAGWKVSIDAFSGVTTQEQMPVLAKAAKGTSGAFVVELGTNDSHQLLRGETTAAAEQKQIAAALDLFGSGCIVWVNVDSDPARPGGTGGGLVNAALAHEAAQRSNLHIVDLGALLAAHPEYLVDDQVHLTGDGYTALGALIATQAEACR
jgi:lysophospholipase L1-like esterase